MLLPLCALILKASDVGLAQLWTILSSPRTLSAIRVTVTMALAATAFNAIYARYFPIDPPARIFVCTPEWFGPFDVEIDCIAMA